MEACWFEFGEVREDGEEFLSVWDGVGEDDDFGGDVFFEKVVEVIVFVEGGAFVAVEGEFGREE